MQGKIDEDIDLIFAHDLRDPSIRHASDLPPATCTGTQGGGDVIRMLPIVIADDLKIGGAVFPEEREEIAPDDVLAKVGRYIANAQRAVRRRFIAMRLDALAQRKGVRFVPLSMFPQEGAGVVFG